MARAKKSTTAASTPKTEPTKPAEQPSKTEAEPPASTEPAAQGAYVWVTKRRSGITVGTHNPRWRKPTLIDAKSLPELAEQGWVVVDGPDATPGDE